MRIGKHNFALSFFIRNFMAYVTGARFCVHFLLWKFNCNRAQIVSFQLLKINDQTPMHVFFMNDRVLLHFIRTYILWQVFYSKNKPFMKYYIKNYFLFQIKSTTFVQNKWWVQFENILLNNLLCNICIISYKNSLCVENNVLWPF